MLASLNYFAYSVLVDEHSLNGCNKGGETPLHMNSFVDTSHVLTQLIKHVCNIFLVFVI